MDFEQFFDEHYGATVRALALAIGDRDRAEDWVQDAFAKAYRRWGRVSAMDRPAAWIYVVALNAERKEWARDERRALRASRRLDGSAEPSPDVATSTTDALDVRSALRALTDRQRTAVVLRYLADLTIVDIARVMGCAEGTVKATLHQSLAKLRVELAEEPV